jgi:hypothetical protein
LRHVFERRQLGKCKPKYGAKCLLCFAHNRVKQTSLIL